MEYVTAIQAATMIGVTERTIREWIKDGKLSAHHPFEHPNRLAIPRSEVEALARKRKQYYVEIPDMTEVAQKLAALEQKIGKLDQLEARHAALEEKYAALEQRLNERVPEWPPSTVRTSESDQFPRAQKRVGERNRGLSPEKDLPPGCLLARDFARMHGIAPETFRDHYMKGLGRALEGKDKVEVSERPKPGREKETERYLTPDQQELARAFWHRHSIAFTQPDEEEEVPETF